MRADYCSDILDTLPCIVFETDADGRILYLNRKGIERFGFTRKEYLGTSIFPHVGGKPEPLLDGMKKALRRRNTVHLSLKTASSGGGSAVSLVSLTPVAAVAEENGAAHIRGLIQDSTALNTVLKEQERVIRKLKAAVDNIRTLRGLLPICAHCKRIRDARGKWHPLETYLCTHTEAEFSHSLCPECLQSLYPDLFEQQKELDFGPDDDAPFRHGSG